MKHYAPLLCVSQFFGTTQKTHKTQCEKRVVPSKVTNVRDEITCPVNGAWRLARKYGFKEERLALLLDPHTLSAVCSNKYTGVIQCA